VRGVSPRLEASQSVPYGDNRAVEHIVFGCFSAFRRTKSLRFVCPDPQRFEQRALIGIDPDA